MADRTNAEAVLQAAGTTEDLEGLLDAIEAAGKEEAFDLIAGTDPIPSNMSDLRALRLRRICETVGRELTTREIEIVFRIGSSGAKVVGARMRATYPRQMAEIKAARTDAMRKAATAAVEKVDKKLRYNIHFSESSALEFARELLIDAGWSNCVQWPDAEHLILDFRGVRPGRGQINLLTDILGLPDPDA
jgi:hypothetical protein